VSDVLATLQRLKVEHIPFGEEVGIRCPWCGYPDSGHPDKTCSINQNTGWGKCQHANRCSQGGFNLYQLRRKLGDKTLPGADMDRPTQSYKKAKPITPDVKAKVDCTSYLAERGFDLEKLRNTGLLKAAALNGNNPTIAFQYIENGQLVDEKYRSRDGKGEPWKNFTRATNYPGLFGFDKVDPTEGYLIISGGELDTLAAWEMGVPNVVNGPSESDLNWIDHHHDWLAGFTDIFLALDSDKTGETKAAEAARRLGRERCLRIRFPKGCKDILDAKVKGKWELKHFRLAMAKAEEFKPRKLQSLAEFMDEIWAEDTELERGDYCQWPTVNKTLRGFRPGEMTLWAGDDGVGKSTLILNLLRHFVMAGIPICSGSFELRPKRQGRWLREMGFEDRAQMEYVAQFFWLINHVGCIEPGKLIEMYVYAAKRYGVRHFVTDSISMLGMDDDDYAGQAEFVRDVKQHLVDPYSVHHHTVSHSRKGKSDATTGRNKADIRGNIHRFHDNVSLTYRDVDEAGNIQTYMEWLKAREFGGVCKIPLTFDQTTRTFTEVPRS
jgi:twinkle protein